MEATEGTDRAGSVISEADFERAVVDLAHLFGWKCAGFRPGQAEWGDTIRKAMRATADVRHHVWRPADSDDIARTLTAGKITTWRLE